MDNLWRIYGESMDVADIPSGKPLRVATLKPWPSRNSEFPRLKMVIVHGYVRLPEGQV